MIKETRERLKTLYGQFVKKWGLMNSPRTKNIISKDIYGWEILASLEVRVDMQYRASDTITKVDGIEEAPFTTSDAKEGLLYVLSMTGRVDMTMLEQVTDKESEELVNELGDSIYWVEEDKEWQESSRFLAGNVYKKMLQCRYHVQQNPENEQLQRALKAIEEVQPEKIPLELLTDSLNLGERWVNPTLYNRYANWLFESNARMDTTVVYLPAVDEYVVDNKYTYSYGKITKEYYVKSKGGVSLNGLQLLKHAMENTTPYLTYSIGYGDNKVTKPDNDAIQLAADKIDTIRREWERWVNELPQEDKDYLVDTYNNLYNCYVLRKYDGSHLTLPGIDLSKLGKDDTPITPYPAQKDGAWRIIQQQGGIMDMEVGLGKTLICVIAAHEMKRMGIRKKPAILALKANVSEIASTYRKAYPGAKVLAPNEKEFDPKNRKRLFYEMKNNDWDCIIMTHDQFGKIPQSDEIQRDILQEEIDDLSRDIDTVRNIGGSVSRSMLKGLENRKQTLTVKLKMVKARIDKEKDDVISFEEMGIDHLVVDECFPYDTLILTDKGWMKIGDIVSEKKNVNVVSYCSESRIFELMPITNWLKKPLVKRMVKITHEHGELICTEDHKIWTIEQGYVRAGQLTSKHTLSYTNVSKVWNNTTRIKAGQILQSEMCLSKGSKIWSKESIQREKQRTNATLSMVQSPTSSSTKEQVLQCDMQNGTSEPTASYQRTETPVWKRIPEISSRGEESTTVFGENETQQPYAQSRSERENEKKSARKNVPIKRWEWTTNRTSDTTVSSTQTARGEYGMGDSNQTCMGTVPISAKSLQSGHWYTRKEAMYRSRWENTQPEEMEVSGQEEDRDTKCSRVVSVEVQERGSYGGCGLSSTEDNYVYDLTVDKNHNYIANGVLVSNCHKYKNLQYTTRHDRVAGLGNTEGSQKALNMLFAIRTLQRRFNGDMQATFLSGTPISNSLTEMYLLFKYLRPKELERQNIRNFDAWAAVYAKKTTDYEFSVTNQIIAKERFRHFIKVPELALFYNEIADYRTKKMINIEEPEMIEELIALPPTDDQLEYIQRLIKFAETGDGSYVDRPPLSEAEDKARMLLATNYAKKMSADMRLIDQFKYEDHPDNKVSVCSSRVAEFYYRFNKQKGTQLVFCDLGTPTKDMITIEDYSSIEEIKVPKFTIYDALKRKLVDEYNIPEEEVQYIHDWEGEKKKYELFKKMNAGEIRVLIGSTEKAGTGLNVQQRVVAMHHMDIPWKPAELTQRNGRGVRPGNWLAKEAQDNKVYVYIYATERSLDSYKFTLLKNKQTFISQMKTNELQVRSIDEGSIDEATGMNFAEYIAVLSGDTTLLEKAKIDKKLAVLENLRTVHYREAHNNKYKLEHNKERLQVVQEYVETLQRDVELYNSNLQRDDTGTKLNPIHIWELRDILVQRETAELAQAIRKQEKWAAKQYLKAKKPKKVKVESEEDTEQVTEKEKEPEIKEASVIIGEYLQSLYKEYRPEEGTASTQVGTLMGFNLYIERVHAGSRIDEDFATRVAQGSNIMSHNKLYAQHPSGNGIKYTHTHGIPERSSSKIAARNYLAAISKCEGLLEGYQREHRNLTTDIQHLEALQVRPFNREDEITALKEDSKRLQLEIAEKIKSGKVAEVTE